MTNEELERLEDYELELFLFYYVYADNIKHLLELSKDMKEDCIILSDSFINTLIDLVNENMEYELLGQKEKNNIFDMLYFIKENKEYKDDSIKEKYFNICNEIIIRLNSTQDENAENFKYDQMLLRISNRESYKNSSYKADINLGDAYANDIVVLNALKTTDNDSFANIAMQFAFNEYFLLSIEKFVNEIPFIFKDEDIYVKTLSIFALNRGVGLNKEYKDAYKSNSNFKTLTKKGRKSLTRLKKTLDDEYTGE